MSRQNKNSRNIQKRKEVTEAHKNGQKLINPKTQHGKKISCRHYLNGGTMALAVYKKRLGFA